MLKNISSMNKKDEKELLEIPEFLKKLSQEHPQTEKVETVIEEKFVSITNIQQVETKVNRLKVYTNIVRNTILL
jgi:hypothetical protein